LVIACARERGAANCGADSGLMQAGSPLRFIYPVDRPVGEDGLPPLRGCRTPESWRRRIDPKGQQ